MQVLTIFQETRVNAHALGLGRVIQMFGETKHVHSMREGLKSSPAQTAVEGSALLVAGLAQA
jgi:hypothetical protein